MENTPQKTWRHPFNRLFTRLDQLQLATRASDLRLFFDEVPKNRDNQYNSGCKIGIFRFCAGAAFQPDICNSRQNQNPMVCQMLIPKVTIRQMLFGMTILGIYSMILSWASQGSVVGYSLSFSIALLILPFAAYCGVYWVLYGVSNLGNRYWLWRTKRLSNPAHPGNERP